MIINRAVDSSGSGLQRTRVSAMHSYVALAFITVLLPAFHGCSGTQPWTVAEGQHPAHFQRQIVRTVGANYLLFLPEGFGARDKLWPLIMFLHGSGERGDSLDRLKVNGLPELVEKRKDFPFIVVSPQLPAQDAWSSDVLAALLDEISTRLPVDTDRVYLTGLSLGGYAAWDVACDLPERFAAIAPVCGVGDPDRACRLRRVPVWAFHGARDPYVPIKEDEEMVEAVRACGGDVRFTVYADGGHDIWTRAYADSSLYTWFLEHRRNHLAHG